MYPEGKRILVIDDDTRRREICERVLLEEGFAVTAVPEGFSAIRAVQGARFALAITAVGLPGMLDGLATMRRLRARQPWLKTLFTGEVACRPQSPDHDLDDFIPSPFGRRDLIGGVFELLQREGAHAAPDRRDRSRAG
jgi:DNA-binding response OmpR family regulator